MVAGMSMLSAGENDSGQKDKGNGAQKRARVKRQAPLRNASTYLAEVKLGILANASASLVAALLLMRLEAKLRARGRQVKRELPNMAPVLIGKLRQAGVSCRIWQVEQAHLTSRSCGILAKASVSLMQASTLMWLEAKLRA